LPAAFLGAAHFLGVEEPVGEAILVRVLDGASGEPTQDVSGKDPVLEIAEDVLQLLELVDRLLRLFPEDRAGEFSGVPGAFPGLAGLVQFFLSPGWAETGG